MARSVFLSVFLRIYPYFPSSICNISETFHGGGSWDLLSFPGGELAHEMAAPRNLFAKNVRSRPFA